MIEVSDSSLAYDRTVKFPQYARAGIAEVWLIDLEGRRIERQINPGVTGYRLIAILERGDTLVSTVLPAVALQWTRSSASHENADNKQPANVRGVSAARRG